MAPTTFKDGDSQDRSLNPILNQKGVVLSYAGDRALTKTTHPINGLNHKPANRTVPSV
ncbi:hypothetical protein G7B40_001755 [Aetokthonos hydrillicola Thurmond2011]|uniref:Uncharacterized protein n=1 Tax=Aetokthonos hydrillicola Thurmond2011 TaxID=2712845 RepID=A0AAP5M740_9CYAN|nr:hypothetical protein [Aetokthonos hydrillicola]MBO3462953.1 hypothetical protein [Aetokthonos hydrillicola CCALA 1050]MBW4590168.1 hypothetical protein [Aetokthonos hydrillicola CCALA 1050]MDR9893312.1 hypothetical protein [Aetokthonos hydrillicola Thurmond2011]